MNEETIKLISILIPVVVAGITILGSVIAASLSFYFSRKRQLEDEQRIKKAEVYAAFYDAMINLGCSPSNPDTIKAFSKAYNKLLFTGSDEVIAAIISWKAEADAKGGKSEFNAPLLKKALDIMRKDLKISKNQIIQGSTFMPLGYK